jgi:MFS family permease
MFDDVHMLRNLGIGFALVAARDATIASMRMVGSPLWGRAVDRAGARPVLLTCAFGLTVVPLIWLLPTPSRWWPVAIEALAGGVLASGFSLSSFALPLSVAPREGRRFYLAIFSTAGGIAFALASAAGGLIAQALPASFSIGGRTVYGLQLLFVLCAAARLSAARLAVDIVETDAEPLPAFLAMAGAKLKRAALPRI